MRFFIALVQKRYRGTADCCWTCGRDGANHLQIVFGTAKWSRIHEHIQNVLSFVFPMTSESLCLSDIPADHLNPKDRKLLYILLAASKNALTRRWLKTEPPTMEEWIDVVQEIYTIEIPSFSLFSLEILSTQCGPSGRHRLSLVGSLREKKPTN